MELGKKKITIIVAGVVVITAVAFGIMRSSKKGSELVSTEVLQKRSLVQTISVTGKIEARDSFDGILGTSQKVKDIYKKVGDSIQVGDTILKLDTAELQYQLSKAQLSLEALKKSTTVSRDQAFFTLENAKNQYSQALNTYNDTKTLFEYGMASSDSVSASAAALNTAENQVKIAEIQYNSMDTSSINSDKKAQADSYRLDIANLQRKIAESSIISTVNGTLTILEAKTNQYPTQSYNKVQVVDLSSLLVKIYVSQEEAVLLKVGQQCTFKVKGMDGDYKGNVSSISNVASISANSSQPKFQVEISIDNPKQDLRVGYEANILVKVGENPETLCAAYGAVKADEDGRKYLFIIKDGRAFKRYVKTGIETADYIEILDGLQEEEYIILPPDTMKEGDPVRIN